MKRIIVGILSIVYIAFAGGIVMNVHYCMGKLSAVSYSYDDHSGCGKCGMESKKGCCHSDVTVVKISDDQQKANAGLDIELPLSYIQVYTLSFLQPVQGISVATEPEIHAPPAGNDPPAFLQNRVFRI